MYAADTLKNNLKDKLDDKQYNIATTRTTIGYRRVKGPAGSGKSLALAARAAVLASEGKRVLVCNFNITLHNYLRDLVEQLIPSEVSQRVIFTNFHKWCGLVCRQTGYWNDYVQYLKGKDIGIYTADQVFDYYIPKLVSDIYDHSNISSLSDYDAILVDEGQDFHIDWWKTLRKSVVQGGEMLLVADKTQNVHETAQAWTEQEMKGCGFSGEWGKLENSYRLPARMISILESFYEQFPYDVGDEGVDIPLPQRSTQTDLLDRFRWVQVPLGRSAVDVCIKEIEHLYNDHAISTVYFLSGTDIGIDVVREFKKRRVDILDTHSKNWQESRDKKVDLHPGCAGICATTLQSFKGWEASHLVVHVEKVESSRDRAVFYTALSRLNKHPQGAMLTVVSSCPKLEEFGRKHFEFESSPWSHLNTFDFNIEDALPF